jgi:hypothetical protein
MLRQRRRQNGVKNNINAVKINQMPVNNADIWL